MVIAPRRPSAASSTTRLQRLAQEAEHATRLRAQIIGGRILLGPPPVGKHVGTVTAIRDRLRAGGLAEGLEAFENVSTFHHGDDDDYATPDLMVTDRAFGESDEWLVPPDDVVLAVEVISPSERLKGINEKTAWYAAAGVVLVLQLDPRMGAWTLYSSPADGEYRGTLHGKYGEPVPLPTVLGGPLETEGLPVYS